MVIPAIRAFIPTHNFLSFRSVMILMTRDTKRLKISGVIVCSIVVLVMY